MINYKKILKQINTEELEEFMLETIIENPYIKEKVYNAVKISTKIIEKSNIR